MAFLNRLNADWVKATKRISPKLIIELLKTSGKAYCKFLASLNPNDKAEFQVAWAGEQASKNWFHIAREYTEKWRHQQQIRLAIGDDQTLLEERWYLPYLDTSVRVLPHHYRHVKAKEGEVIKFTFPGNTEKSWFLHYKHGWELMTATHQAPISAVRIKDADAWKIFTKSIPGEEAIANSKIIGDQKLATHIFDMITVMA